MLKMTELPENQLLKSDIVTRGKFIVFEGIDGSGKSTQISLLEKRLKDNGRSIVKTAEPTNTAIGGLIRDALSGITIRNPYELAALFLADRIAHNTSPIFGIEKFLSQGTDVICDRYYYSSFAYQGIDADLKWVMDINLECPQILKPDICIFLDIDPEQSQRRMIDERAFLEIFENEKTLSKIRSRFYDVFELLHASENIKIIDANRTIDVISNEIFECIFNTDA